jgi:hypothetical protein
MTFIATEAAIFATRYGILSTWASFPETRCCPLRLNILNKIILSV